MSIITLLTDFGIGDEYVGVMKGVILSVNPSAVTIDITHQIEPQDLIQAAYLLKSIYRFFPQQSVHVTVVDPGVGSQRAILALEHRNHLFLAPDNGVLTLLLDEGLTGPVVRVDNDRYFLKPVSSTFHGRDIFAPVAAHLSMGIGIDRLGAQMGIKDLVRLNIPRPWISADNELVGTIVSIDRFGNLITSIEKAMLEKFCTLDKQKALSIKVGGWTIRGVTDHYSSTPPQQPLALIGSRGYLELAVNCGNARRHFKAAKGDAVRLSLKA